MAIRGDGDVRGLLQQCEFRRCLDHAAAAYHGGAGAHVHARHRASQPWFVAEPWTRSTRHVIGFLSIIVATVAYIGLAESIGFLIVGAVVLFALFQLFGVRPLRAAIVAVVATLVIWYAFYKLLRVPLPWGMLKAYAF